MELPVDQVVGGDDATQPLDAYWSGQAVDTGLCHQHRHGPGADLDTHAHGELGVDTAVAVGAVGGDVDLPDQPGQPVPP